MVFSLDKIQSVESFDCYTFTILFCHE